MKFNLDYIVFVCIALASFNFKTNCLPSRQTDNRCQDQPNGSFLFHPLGCKYFIVCNNGEVNMGACPDGLAFNPLRPPCDLEENVDCSDVESTTETATTTTTSTTTTQSTTTTESTTTPSTTTSQATTTASTSTSTLSTTVSTTTQSTTQPTTTRITTSSTTSRPTTINPPTVTQSKKNVNLVEMPIRFFFGSIHSINFNSIFQFLRQRQRQSQLHIQQPEGLN